MSKKSKQALSCSISFFMIFFLVFNGWPKNVKAETNNKYVAIAAGYYHMVALDSNGHVWSWGDNHYGQLGTGDNTNRNVPTEISIPAKIVSVSAGKYNTEAIDSNGHVWGWGHNYYSELGTGDNVDRNTPTQILIPANIVSISAGESHTEAIDSGGHIWSWGDNSCGQLGTGDNTNRNVPTKISALSGIISISVGEWHTEAIDINGLVWSWGDNSYGQLGTGDNVGRNTPTQILIPANIVSISAGEWYTEAIDADGFIWSWGDNYYGQLGKGDRANRNIPAQIITIPIQISSIATGDLHSLALDTSGGIWSFGGNFNGELGTGDNAYRDIPTQITIPGLTSSKIKAVATGSNFTVALDEEGKIWSFGNNSAGQLGSGDNANSNVPVNINDADNVSLDKASLEIGYASGDNSSNVTQNITLPTQGTNGTTISWHSNDTTVISDTGNVIRPAIGSGNKTVTLTATITKGSYTSKKDFTLTVLENFMSITSVSFPQDGIYKVGDNLDFVVNFNGIVEVNSSSGTPYLPITINNKPAEAHYISGSGTSSLILRYTIVKGDDSSGIITGNSLNLNGGNIVSGYSSGVPCGITFSGGSLPNIIIDATPPTFDSSNGAALDSANKKLTLTFSKNIVNACANLDALRSNITFSSDGINFNALSANDDVAIENGKLIITFDKTLIGQNNKIKIAANSIKDGAGNIKADETDVNFISGISMLMLDTTNPTAGTVNLPYNFKFLSSGGLGSKVYSLETGSLPNGLNLMADGTLSGTPTSSGTFTFKVKVTDASGQLSDNEYTMVVNEPAPPMPTGVVLNLKFTGQNSQSSAVVNVPNFNFTSSTASNGIKQYEFDLQESKVSELEGAGLQANSSSVEIMDGNNNSIGKVEFPSMIISEIGFSPNINVSFPVTIIGKSNFPSQEYMANLSIATLGTNKHFKVSFMQVNVPDVPTNISAVAGNGSAVVSFTPPTNNGGSPIINYKVISNTGALVGVGTGSPITITGLTNGVTYNFKVLAVNSKGDSLPSGVSNGVTPSAPYIPQPPIYIPPAPQPVTETRTVPVTAVVGKSEFALGNLAITRTINLNGAIDDVIILDENAMSQIIANALKDNATSVDIILSDSVSSAANSIGFQADGNCTKLLQENKLSLNVKTAKGSLNLPNATLMQLTGTIVQATFSEIFDSRESSIISEYAAGAKQIGTSLKLDTNFSGDADVIIPITADELQSQSGNSNFLSNLAVMAQHSDGENEVVSGTIVYDSSNKPVGIKIHVKKFSIFTLIELPNSTNDGNAKVIPYKVNSDKVWTVNFSNDIDKATVNKDNVYVLDEEGNKVDIKLECSGKALTISPVENYKSGHKYQLYISDKVQSINKKALKKALEYEFNVI